MIRIYADMNEIPEENLVYCTEVFFDEHYPEIEWTEKDIEYMKRFSHAEYKGNNVIVTPFGQTTVEKLCTGCKHVLLLNHAEQFADKVFNIIEIDQNVEEAIIYEIGKGSVCNLYPYGFNIPNVKVEYVVHGVIEVSDASEVLDWIYYEKWK